MTNVEVLDWNKKKIGQMEVPSEMVESEVKKELLHTVVRWQLMSRRQGTHSTKTRSFVRGGGKKPFKQKGTGNARQGTSRSPLMPGGAILHGPQPRDYSYTLPKNIRRKGLKVALSHLYKEGKLFVVEDMTSGEGKTKELATRLEKFGVTKALLIDSEPNELFSRAAKNLKGFRYNNVNGVNVYDLLKYKSVVFTKDSMEKLVARLGGQ